MKFSFTWPAVFTEPETATACVTEPRVTVEVRSSAFAGAALMRDAMTAPPTTIATSARAKILPGHVASVPWTNVMSCSSPSNDDYDGSDPDVAARS